MKQLSQKEFEKCPKWLKKPKTFHSKLETLRYETIPITFHLNFVGEKLFIILSVSVLSVSVSADMKIIISVFYRYRPIWKKAYRSYTDLDVLKVDRTAIVNRTYVPTYPKSLKVQGVSIPQWLQSACLACLMHGEMVLISRACFCLGIYAACFLWPICKSPHHCRDRPCPSDMNLVYFLAWMYVLYFAGIFQYSILIK